MAISFTCDLCGKQLRAFDRQAGLLIQCPACTHPLVIPGPAAEPAAPAPLPPEQQALALRPASPLPAAPRPASPAVPAKSRVRRRRRIAPEPRLPLWPWLVGAGLLVVVFGVGLTCFLLGESESTPEPESPRTADLRKRKTESLPPREVKKNNEAPPPRGPEK
jgi:hypothetical protein